MSETIGISFGESTLDYDPGTGIEATLGVSSTIGEYSGVSIMFDDTLIPD